MGWTEERALARWRELAPNVVDWEQAVVMPAEQRRPMARALLRGGNVVCREIETNVHCSMPDRRWRELPATAGFDDPCLRRLLVPWALGQLEPGDVGELEPLLATLVALLPPEDELPERAFAVATDDAMRLRLLAAVHAASEAATARLVAAADNDQDAYLVADEDGDILDARAEALAAQLTTDAGRLAARAQLGLEGGIDGLDPVAHRATHLAALADPELMAETRAAALARFGDDRGADVTTALVAAAGAADCGLAAEAAAVLAARGDPSYQPARPTSLEPKLHIQALCRLQVAELDDGDARWRAWFGPTVEVVRMSENISVPLRAPDHWSRSSERVRAAEVELPEELSEGNWACHGLSCTRNGHPRDVTIDFVRAGATLRIKRLTWRQWDGDDC